MIAVCPKCWEPDVMAVERYSGESGRRVRSLYVGADGVSGVVIVTAEPFDEVLGVERGWWQCRACSHEWTDGYDELSV